jgi:DNA-binding NtrC family response regulator
VANVLIVDDDDDIRSLVSMLVEMAGHCVREAANGREGMQAVTENRPDLVLLDVEMPILTGPEMAYEMFIRDCGIEKIPIILISGVVGLDEVAEMVGTRYFLTKPYDPEALLKLVNRALREHAPPRPKLEVRR